VYATGCAPRLHWLHTHSHISPRRALAREAVLIGPFNLAAAAARPIIDFIAARLFVWAWIKLPTVPTLCVFVFIGIRRGIIGTLERIKGRAAQVATGADIYFK